MICRVRAEVERMRENTGLSLGWILRQLGMGRLFAPLSQPRSHGGRLDVGSNSSPGVADWNGDGKKDPIIGNSDGEIFVFLNKGTNEDPQYGNEGDRLPLKFGRDASPRVMNWGRGSNDLVVADRNGEVTLAINMESFQAPTFPEKKVLRAGKR